MTINSQSFLYKLIREVQQLAPLILKQEKISGTKYFGVGMNKTGTTTLHNCFVEFGLQPVACPKNMRTGTKRLTRHILNGENYAPAVRAAAHFQSFEDRPWNIWKLYQALDDAYPDSRFILTERNPESWWKSVNYWLLVSQEGNQKKVSTYLNHLNVDRLDKSLFIEAYQEHNRSIKEYFSGRSNLLVIDFENGDGWDKLCKFFDKPIPDKPFPHANRQKYN